MPNIRAMPGKLNEPFLNSTACQLSTDHYLGARVCGSVCFLLQHCLWGWQTEWLFTASLYNLTGLLVTGVDYRLSFG